MTRYLARNRRYSDSGVQSKRTSVSLWGSAFSPRQSELNRTGAASAQEDGVGNPWASGSAGIRTATAVRSVDIMSCPNILMNGFQCSPALQLPGSSQNNQCPEMHKKKAE